MRQVAVRREMSFSQETEYALDFHADSAEGLLEFAQALVKSLQKRGLSTRVPLSNLESFDFSQAGVSFRDFVTIDLAQEQISRDLIEQITRTAQTNYQIPNRAQEPAPQVERTPAAPVEPQRTAPVVQEAPAPAKAAPVEAPAAKVTELPDLDLSGIATPVSVASGGGMPDISALLASASSAPSPSSPPDIPPIDLGVPADKEEPEYQMPTIDMKGLI